MRVTSIEPCTKTKYKVFLDEEFAFVLYQGELSRYQIREGQELTDEKQERIWEETVCKRAKKRALHLLEDMDRSEAKLREKLLQSLYGQRAVDCAVAYVKSFGYLDDERYAENFVRSKSATKSRREIRAALLEKGVEREQIERALELCFQEDTEQQAILRLLRKKGVDPEHLDGPSREKIRAYLGRKGFAWESIRQVTQMCDDNA